MLQTKVPNTGLKYSCYIHAETAPTEGGVFWCNGDKIF